MEGPPFATYSSDGRRWASPKGMHTHSFRRLRNEETRRLEQRYSPDVVPEWFENEHDICEKNKNEYNKWWVESVSSLEKIHRHTFDSVLEDGLLTNNYIYAHASNSHAADTIRQAETIAYNIRRFLREIDIRGPAIQKEILGRWTSPLHKKSTTTHPVKSALSATPICCGGGGGGGGGGGNI